MRLMRLGPPGVDTPAVPATGERHARSAQNEAAA